MSRLEGLLQVVRTYLPPPGTKLGSYTFLAPDALWTGTKYKEPFVAVAEDRWNNSGSGTFLAVLDISGVYIMDLKRGRRGRSAINYCAASFPCFMKIMKLCETARETTPAPESVKDKEGYRRLEEVERVLREQVAKIDPTALSRDLNFWSTWIEEFGYGM